MTSPVRGESAEWSLRPATGGTRELGPPPPGERARFAIRGSRARAGEAPASAPRPLPVAFASLPAAAVRLLTSRRPPSPPRGTPAPHAGAQGSTRERACHGPSRRLLHRSTVPYCSRAPARVAYAPGCAPLPVRAYARGTAEQTPPGRGGDACSGGVPSFRLSPPSRTHECPPPAAGTPLAFAGTDGTERALANLPMLHRTIGPSAPRPSCCAAQASTRSGAA